MVELTIESENNITFDSILVKSLPDNTGKTKIIHPIPELYIPQGKVTYLFCLNNQYDVISNIGRLFLEYSFKENADSDKQCNKGDTTIVLRELHSIFTDAGILLGYGKDGIIKGAPTASISIYSKQTRWATLFSEINLDAQIPIDSITGKDPYQIFSKGGSVLDVQMGFSFYPWYEGCDYEIIAPFFGYGLRTFKNNDIEYKQRMIAGLTIDFFPLTGNMDNGYLDIGYAYDKFWDMPDSSKDEYDPNRIFLKGHVDFYLYSPDRLASLELKADLPIKGKGHGNVGIVFITSVDIPKLLANAFDSVLNFWGKTETK